MVSLVEHYTIAICTQGRNSNLNNAITILNEINKSTKYKFEVLIVLNSSISTIETFRNARIVIEPNLGYSSVRNTALKSVKSSSNLIFIDDDEIPSLTWFENLVSMHEKFQDDIIVGPIYPYREDLLNKQSYRSQFTQMYKSRPDEALVKQGATANMLIPASLISKDVVHFDLYFNKSGSEDTDFCFRVRKAGYAIRYAKYAEILEIESPERFDIKYLNKRFIRDVSNYSVVIRRNASIGAQIYRGSTLLARVIIFGISQLINRSKSVKFKAYRLSFLCLLTGKVKF